MRECITRILKVLKINIAESIFARFGARYAILILEFRQQE